MSNNPDLATASPSAADPVCGMAVDPSTARASHEHAGQVYHFCLPSCAEKFRADPDRYLGHQAGGRPPEARGAAKQAVDPVCGMTVDPLRAAGSAEH